MASQGKQIWEVIGGSDAGGIMVRDGEELTSTPKDGRLSVGATVAEEELVGKRLRFTRLTGTGPDEGWVSIVLKDKTLLAKAGEQAKPEQPEVGQEPESEASPDDADRPPQAAADDASAVEDDLMCCTFRRPVVGEQVSGKFAKPQLSTRLGDPPNTYEWELLAGELATVVEVDDDDDFILSNRQGEKSAWLFRDNFNYRVKEAKHTGESSPAAKKKRKRKPQGKTTLGEKLALAKTLQSTASSILQGRGIEETGPLAELAKHLQDIAFQVLLQEKAARKAQSSHKEQEADIDTAAETLHVEQKDADGNAEERCPEDDEQPRAEPSLQEEAPNFSEVQEEQLEDEAEVEGDEDSDEDDENKDRSTMKCASYGCPYCVHSKSVFGSYCCIACYENGGVWGHGEQCERLEWKKCEKCEVKKDATENKDGGGESTTADKQEAEEKKAAEDTEGGAKADDETKVEKDKEAVKKVADVAKPVAKTEVSKEAKEAKEVIEQAKKLAHQMQDNSNALLKVDSETDWKRTAKEDGDTDGVTKKDAKKLQQEERLSIAKTLQDTATLILKDGVLEKAGSLAKKLQDMAFSLLKEDVKAEQEEALDKSAQSSERKYASSDLKEESTKSVGDWRIAISKHRRANDQNMLMKTLQDGAEAILKDGTAFEEAMRWAKECETTLRKLSSRWRLGVILDIIGQLHLKLSDSLNEPSGDNDNDDGEKPLGTRRKQREHVKEAVAIVSEAVELLKKIGHSREEASLATARATLAEARTKSEALEDGQKVIPKGRTAVRSQGGETDKVKAAQAAVAEKRKLYKMAPEGRGDHEGLAHTLKVSAEVLLKAGHSDEAGLMAQESSSLYRKLGNAKELGIVLSIAARTDIRKVLEVLEASGVNEVSMLQSRQHLLKAKTASTEAVALLRKGTTPEWITPLTTAQCTLLAVRGLENTGSQADSGALSMPLERKFGYAAGLEKPTPFARFDIRDEVCKAFGGFTHGQVVRDEDKNKYVVVGVKAGSDDPRQPRQLWFQPQNIPRAASCCFPGLLGNDLAAVLTPVGMEGLQEIRSEDLDADEDSDGEPIVLCHECLLPLGSTKYKSEDGEGLLHGECCAQNLLASSKNEDAKWKAEEMRKKNRDRVEYNIGWRPERMMPRNEDFLREHHIPTPAGATPDSMYCLMLEAGDPPRVRIVPTNDPETAVCLEYLLIALQVRMKAGMAPYFSLDTPKADEQWQVKVFGPPWLKGTSVGEVLFQSDYHLKELSMGETLFEQPVVGMKSCWDYKWIEEGWRGREWFVVRDAKVTLSENNILVPYVRMGVEARSQEANTQNQLVDAPVTSKGHPLVKFADDFSHNFDLIAERKSVVFCLREVSRAAIVAKFLLDNKIKLDDYWLKSHDKSDVCKLDLPFNKQERTTYEILVCDGAVKEVQGGVLDSTIGIYGGVDLNIDSFDLTMPLRLTKALKAPDYAAIYGSTEHSEGTSTDLGKLSQRDLRKLIQKAGGQAPHGPAEKSDLIEQLGTLQTDSNKEAEEKKEEQEEGLEYLPALEEDLRKILLSEDNVREVVSAIRARVKAHNSGELPDQKKGFWDSLDEDSEEAKLLKGVFNARFCDRRLERSLFVAPVAKERYRKGLQALLDEEAESQEKRRKHFVSMDFVPTAPGDLFPSAWKTMFNIFSGRGSSVAAGGDKASHTRQLVESKSDGSHLVRDTKPIFDKSTADGHRFRIYSRGTLEVRTTQDDDGGEETVGAVFDILPGSPPAAEHPITKVTLFVKSNNDAPKQEGQPEPARSYSYFVVFETDLGDAMVLQKAGVDAPGTLDENPGDIEERYLWARVVSAADLTGTGTCVRDIRQHHAAATASKLSGRRYTKDVFEWAGGTAFVAPGAGPGGVCQVPGMHVRGEARTPWSQQPKAAPAPAVVRRPQGQPAFAPKAGPPQVFPGGQKPIQPVWTQKQKALYPPPRR